MTGNDKYNFDCKQIRILNLHLTWFTIQKNDKVLEGELMSTF